MRNMCYEWPKPLFRDTKLTTRLPRPNAGLLLAGVQRAQHGRKQLREQHALIRLLRWLR
jgi:hypothetical protein